MPPARKTSEKPLLERSHSNGPFPTARERAREELVGSWFGEPVRPEALAKFHSQAKRITPYVDKFLDRLQPREDRILADIQGSWPQVTAGDQNLLRLKPVRLFRKALTLEAPDAMTAFVVRTPRLQELLLAKLSALVPDEVQQLRIVLKGRR